MEANTKQSLSELVQEGATGIHWFSGDETIEVTTADKKLMTKIKRLAKVNNDVVIDQEARTENGGIMLAIIPYDCLKLGNPKKCNIPQKK